MNITGLKIPTGGRQTSWLGYKHDRGVELGSTEKQLQPGAIIGDGDRKRAVFSIGVGHMIWDNFSIFRTNCAIGCGTRAYILYGLPKYQIQRLQSVQNCAARLVKRYPKFGHISPLLFELHWLPVEHRIVFKILLLVFKSLNNLAPSYISDLLTPYIPSRSLRPSNQSLLVVPRSIQKSYGDRAFAVAAPRLWNALPISMRQPGFSLAAFKKCLKTYLFKNAFFKNIL